VQDPHSWPSEGIQAYSWAVRPASGLPRQTRHMLNGMRNNSDLAGECFEWRFPALSSLRKSLTD
jgi:hypothetical protein